MQAACSVRGVLLPLSPPPPCLLKDFHVFCVDVSPSMAQPGRHGDSHLETSLKVMNQIVQQKVLLMLWAENVAPPTHLVGAFPDTNAGPTTTSVADLCSCDISCVRLLLPPSWLQMFAKSHDEFAVVLCGSEGMSTSHRSCASRPASTVHFTPPLPPFPSPFFLFRHTQ